MKPNKKTNKGSKANKLSKGVSYMKNEFETTAKWIWIAGDEPLPNSQSHQLVYFNRTFIIEEKAAVRLVINVSADSRYRLYLNGDAVAVGPCKGDAGTHYYEQVDVTPYLRTGTNVLAAKVLHFSPSQPFAMGPGGPASVWRSQSGAFLLEGEVVDEFGDIICALHTDEQWSCLEDQAMNFSYNIKDPLFIGGMEDVDGRVIEPDWNAEGMDKSRWRQACVIAEQEDQVYGALSTWNLTPRPIPQLYELAAYFRSITKVEGSKEDIAFHLPLDGTAPAAPMKIPAGTRIVIELDAGELTTGYPVLVLGGGRNSIVKLLYAECYERPQTPSGKRQKGRRDDASGVLYGQYDRYTVGGTRETRGGSGTQPEIYEPFWFRTFRFVRLEVETADEPLELQHFYYRETGYPLEIKAEFQSSDATFAPLWDISVNTLKRCMHETYEDCPYYEQLQYAMDTRLQALFTYQLSADDRLARKAIFDFHSSQLPSGMLQSRYPSVSPQVIPGFSLYWIMMVHDHYQYFDDVSLVRLYLPTIDGVLGWFDRLVGSDGLVGKMPIKYWSFVDWVQEWHAGVPAAHGQGALTIYNLMYISALFIAAELNEAARRFATAEEYRVRAGRVRDAVNQHCWSAERMLYRDGPLHDEYSQHCQIWAVLSGTMADEEAVQLMRRTLVDTALPQVSYAMSFFLFRALEQTGLYELSFPLWDTWRELAALNLTTWVEDPVSQRSDCHAWGAVPLYEFTALILGVKPGEAGCKRIVVEPKPGPLTWARGTVAVPQGIVAVEWSISGEGQFEIRIHAPEGIPVDVRLPDGRIESFTPKGEAAHCLTCAIGGGMQTANE
ncbi:hypothetical protein EBB07_02335 [Paenibacillaceae bacterium]|nr:hypothetical protein EBB07_02335 [Paenibacillaceae bacterium]